jgi:hypothetical protein
MEEDMSNTSWQENSVVQAIVARVQILRASRNIKVGETRPACHDDLGEIGQFVEAELLVSKDLGPAWQPLANPSFRQRVYEYLTNLQTRRSTH